MFPPLSSNTTNTSNEVRKLSCQIKLIDKEFGECIESVNGHLLRGEVWICQQQPVDRSTNKHK